MRYIIIGAGAVGGTIGGRLAQSGREVVLVARGAHLDAIRQDGLHLLSPHGTVTLPVTAAAGPEEIDLRPDDVLVLAVKTQDSQEILSAWAPRPVAGGGTAADVLPLLCAQNAVENERMALRLFRHVYGVCVWLPALHLSPGAVVSHGAPLSGLLTLGRYPGGTDETIERIAADLRGAMFLAPVVPDVMRWKYGKLLTNLGNAPQAICGLAPGAGPLVERLLDEGRAVLAAAGIPFTSPEEEARVRGDQVHEVAVDGLDRPGGSSWQSLAKGSGSIEADYLNGEIILLGRLHGVPVPANETVRRLAAEFAREQRPPGSMSLPDLLKLVEEEAAAR
ncbi:2-dehydropantoate 2-reductase [Sphaerisporangium melleum]|uniref:2-dehydropantoate 2-reductase n=1 Tax=Sphaerisporangium melleum TaxID=321316 RepID=A0A917VJ95_9ACTN|nr:2-dehydropantoate 2-reductase N-terminal domain-containing protein [Sphaerisporangium melleum]GGK89838.1 2-dehydropantoate 2-reductase [Sphaerisporangium melleum]GII72548.1 2-dehydropantoate 2-reductase [Sphaerisporangium melleum]